MKKKHEVKKYMAKFGYQKPTKTALLTSAGAVVGAITPPLIRKFFPGTLLAGTIPAPWCNNDVIIPMVAGGVALGAGLFVKSNATQSILVGFGLVSLVTGALRGALPEYGFPVARAGGVRLI